MDTDRDFEMDETEPETCAHGVDVESECQDCASEDAEWTANRQPHPIGCKCIFCVGAS